MSKLFIVPTPIGNLEDITFRAIRILKESHLILAEDTRQTAKLLNHYDIKTRMKSHHQFNEHKTIHGIIDQLITGDQIALVSDAGTPGISDPGFLLIRACLQNQIEVECLPGATAFVPALVNSGLPTDHFIFEGFLPHKKGRKIKLEKLAQESYTIVLYESPFRLVKTLNQLIEYFGDERQVSVSRELTKIHEETIRGSIREILTHFENQTIKGEIVIILSGKK
jgi:16S rRNA (cytidine1402-2'-O)-methyltransferase